ncbi:exosome complex component RRP43-like protein [Thamnocephalis sphaerospora]|uniref:Ribosomal RNA-processing protein 43 n=1 Tax=Thamnocephalis sphaerospora TaxID=78915 RepID=A0A4P9XWW6_9FUNG|nr:exosome complex component RRP43-like protein [Thamnocephalis sphaerospora]|eukprot:RKP10858.1 exosome complex component RRP43-like protein [Thamnocephalis sphaerospora]
MTSPYAFSAETFKRVQPSEYYRKFLEQDVRPDGRAFSQFRKTILNAGCISTANGSAVVRIGDTTVVCGIKAEVAEPTLDQPAAGYFVPNVELGPLCSAKFRPGPPGDLAQVVSERLRKLSEEYIAFEELCIEPEQAAWVVYADLVCLNHDGNVLDACQLALLAALKNARLPEAQIGEDGIVRAGEAFTRAITIKRPILAATFGLYEGRSLLADPNASEEPLLDSLVTVCVDDAEHLHAVWKSNGGRCSLEQLQRCVELARIRFTELSALLESSAADQ